VHGGLSEGEENQVSEFLTDDQGEADGEKTDGKSLRAFAKETAKENAALKAELEALKSQVNTQALVSLWDDLDVKASDKVKAQYKGEPTADALKAWVEEHKDVYRFEPKGETTETETTDEVDDFSSQQAALQAAQSLGKDKGVLGDMAARMAKLKNSSAKSPADLDALFDGILPD
jgi:hypothetical protein